MVVCHSDKFATDLTFNEHKRKRRKASNESAKKYEQDV